MGGVTGVLATAVGIKNNSTMRNKSRKIFQPKNNRILSLRFRGGVATLLTDNATETGNTGWLWPSCRQPIHPHLRLIPLCLLAHHRPWWGHPNSGFGRRVFLYTTTPTLVWVKSFSPNSLIATIEVLFLDRPLCCLQPQLQRRCKDVRNTLEYFGSHFMHFGQKQ